MYTTNSKKTELQSSSARSVASSAAVYGRHVCKAVYVDQSIGRSSILISSRPIRFVHGGLLAALQPSSLDGRSIIEYLCDSTRKDHKYRPNPTDWWPAFWIAAIEMAAERHLKLHFHCWWKNEKRSEGAVRLLPLSTTITGSTQVPPSGTSFPSSEGSALPPSGTDELIRSGLPLGGTRFVKIQR